MQHAHGAETEHDRIREIVVVSGKGGTGKTTLTACLAALAHRKVLADADVDAADLFILLEPTIERRWEFRSGAKATIDKGLCTQCGECAALCRYGAISPQYAIDQIDCEGCGLCARYCPAGAITLEQRVAGEWYLSRTCYGPFVHARLGIGEENSGKLVSVVRHYARVTAEERGYGWIIVDGPPGVGCPVISSITGSSLVLIVTEPTLSGIHDMRRVADLASHFGVPSAVCINKWDLNREVSADIAECCRSRRIPVVGKIPYDRTAMQALVSRRVLVEYDPRCEASIEIRASWERVQALVQGSASGDGE